MKISISLLFVLIAFLYCSCSEKNETSDSNDIKKDSVSTDSIKSDTATIGSQVGVCTPSTEHLSYLNRIEKKELKEVLRCINFSTIPFQLPTNTEESESKEALSEEVVKAFFIDKENGGGEENDYGNFYYPVTAFYQKDKIGVIVIHYYTPGAFGINNYFYNLYLFNYKGEQLKMVNLGCNCIDTNMGSNDYYANTIDSAFVGENKIRLYTKDTHATLVESEDMEGKPFEEIELDSSIIKY